MARLARIVVPGVAHHVTQMGWDGQDTFFSEADYAAYAALLAEGCAQTRTAVWAYCLMPNHVHLILVPRHEDGLRAALGETHRRYARHVNGREGWRGRLWQQRFRSFPLDEAHLGACACYVELNPLRARLVRKPERWPWSSAQAHLAGSDDGLVRAAPLLRRHPEWRALLAEGLAPETIEALRRHSRTGRPLGSPRFLKSLERKTGRTLTPGRPGRPRKDGKG